MLRGGGNPIPPSERSERQPKPAVAERGGNGAYQAEINLKTTALLQAYFPIGLELSLKNVP